jgi:hypothetical protein
MTFRQISSEQAPTPTTGAKPEDAAATPVPLEQRLAQMAELMARTLRRDYSEASNSVVTSIMALKRIAA